MSRSYLLPAAASSRFVLGAGIGLLLLTGTFLLLIFGPTSYAQVQRLGHITYHEGHYKHLQLSLTPARYQLLRGTLAAVVVLSAGLLLLLRRGLKPEGIQLGHEARQLRTALRRLPGTLLPSERWLGGGLLLALLAARIWYLLAYPLSTDEAASYDYFVREGPLAISSFYPIPNNHLLFSFGCWPLSLLTDNVLLVMRLPTLLASTVGTVLAYALLTRTLGFRAATWATGLFSFTPLGLYYAVAGRGYFLQLSLLILAFFAAVALLQLPQYRRLAWLTFLGASIGGLYTIPTFAYPLAALGLALLLGLSWQRRGWEMGQLGLAGLFIGLTTVLLYLPVLCISGPKQLLGNGYVAGREGFWPKFPGYLHFLADSLTAVPQWYIGPAVLAALLALGPLLAWAGPKSSRTTVLLAWVMLALTPVCMALQQVLVPPRVLLYAVLFASILLGIGLALVLRRLPTWAQLLLTVLTLAAYGSYHLVGQLEDIAIAQTRAQQTQAAYRWLTDWNGRRIFLNAPYYELFFLHYAHLEHRPLQLHAARRPGPPYDFVVLDRDAPLPAWVTLPAYRVAYEDEQAIIYGRVQQQEAL